MNDTHTQDTPQNPTVLIVDDVPANLALLFDYLEQESFRVLVAQSGAKALTQLQRMKPDIILLDVMMPGMNGFETCQLIKANADTCEIPIIFLTSLDDVVDKVRGFEMGGVDYITKPIEDVEVLARLRTHLTIHDLQHRLRQQLNLALAEVQERNTQLAHTNEILTTLHGSYNAEMTQRQRTEQEKDSLMTIIEQQTEQWRILSRFLLEESDTPRHGLGQALTAQAAQNLGLVLHSLTQIAQSLHNGQSVEPSTKSHFQNTMGILEKTKNYLDEISQAGTASKTGNEANSVTSAAVLSELTVREQEVLQLLVDGESNSEICRKLIVSESTVRTYRMRIMQKLDVDSFAGLVKFAVKHNLTSLD
ncbi:MAG: response regulator transcription factor [Chloroflexota bacterium]